MGTDAFEEKFVIDVSKYSGTGEVPSFFPH